MIQGERFGLWFWGFLEYRKEKDSEIDKGRKKVGVNLPFCHSKLAFILGVSHAPNFSHMAPLWPPFGLDRFSSLV